MHRQSFALRVHQSAERTAFLATIYIDGQFVSQGICKGGKRTTVPSNLLKNPHAPVTDDFIFYNLRTPAPGSSDSDGEDEVGEIRLELRRVQCVDGQDRCVVLRPVATTSPNSLSSEVAAVALNAPTPQHPDEVDPCAVFVWRYRDLGTLNLPTPIPVPSPAVVIDRVRLRADHTAAYLQSNGIAPALEPAPAAQHARASSASSYDPALFEDDDAVFPQRHRPVASEDDMTDDVEMVDDDADADADADMDDVPDMYEADADESVEHASGSDVRGPYAPTAKADALSQSIDMRSFAPNTRKGDGHLLDHIGPWQQRMALSEAHGSVICEVAAAVACACAVACRAPLARCPQAEPDVKLDADVQALEVRIPGYTGLA